MQSATLPNSLDSQSAGTTTDVAARSAQLSKHYGDGETIVRALDEVSIGFEARKFTAIMGPSGSGKSTLLHCMAGLDRPTSGSVWLGGVELSTLDEEDLTVLRRDRLGFVFQSFNLVPTLSAMENIMLPLNLGRTKPNMERVNEIIASVGLIDRVHHRPSELSGGQQQRVAVARAMASRPDVIFADEPTGNLDSTSGSAILNLMTTATQQFDQTIVMVTHDPVAATHADRVVVLGDGRVVDDLLSPSADVILQAVTNAATGATSRGL